MLSALALAVLGAAPLVAAQPPPVLIMVHIEGPPAFLATQEGLREELSLLLDGFMVMSTPVEKDDFARLSLAEQLAAVLPVTKANEAVAAVWLAQPLKGQLMLHLVAMGTGRTLVRTIEFDRKSQSPSALALMLRELLGTAFLFEPTVAQPEEVKVVVEKVRDTVAPLPPIVAPPPQPSAPGLRWEVGGGGLVEAGLAGGSGPSSRYGGAAEVAGRLGPLRLGVEVGLVSQFAQPSPTVFLTATSLQPVATASVGFRLGGLEVGPHLGVGAELSWVASSSTLPRELFGAGLLGSGGLWAQGGAGPLRVRLRWALLVRSFRGQVLEFEYAPTPSWALPTLALRVSLSIFWEGF